MRISDWSSDLGSSDLGASFGPISTTSSSTPVESFTRRCSKSPIIELLPRASLVSFRNQSGGDWCGWQAATDDGCLAKSRGLDTVGFGVVSCHGSPLLFRGGAARLGPATPRSEEHTSELQSLMRTSYAVFCLKKKQAHN